jgi:hypothetical protein
MLFGNYYSHKSRVQSPAGVGIFLFATTSRTALGPPVGANRTEREADHSPLSSAQVKNAWSYTRTLYGMVFKHMGNIIIIIHVLFSHTRRFVHDSDGLERRWENIIKIDL